MGHGGRREHRPHDLGPRVYREGRYWKLDLRPWGGGRIAARNPRARGWPERGKRTEEEDVAHRWKWSYVDYYRARGRGSDLGTKKHEPLVQLAERFHAYRERQRKSPSTLSGGRTALRHLMEYAGENTDAHEAVGRIQDMFDNLLDAGYAPRTVQTLLGHYYAFCKWASVDMPDVRVPKPHSEQVRAWTPEELVLIRHVADEMGMRLEVELALGTGCRHTELLALQGSDFNHSSKTVFVRRQVEKYGSRGKIVTRLKSRKPRVAVVLPFVWGHLPDEQGVLVVDQNGRVQDPRRSHEAIAKLHETAGLDEPGAAWHRYRHTYARLFYDHGGWTDELQRSLGHRSIQTTETMYGHFCPDRAASFAVARMYGEGRGMRVVD